MIIMATVIIIYSIWVLPGVSSPYTLVQTKYKIKQYKNRVQTIQNTANTSTHSKYSTHYYQNTRTIVNTPTRNKTYYTHTRSLQNI
jgi:kynurenine formamidase